MLCLHLTCKVNITGATDILNMNFASVKTLLVVLLSVMATTSSAGVFSNAAQGQQLAAANTKFALDLYKLHTSQPETNIFMSPLSISVALAMTYLGAKGNTSSQMRDVLHFGEIEESHLHTCFLEMCTALNKPNQPFKLYMANRLFGDKSYKFMEEFLTVGFKHYGCELAPVDFSGNPTEAEEVVNKWVSENTANMVKEIIPRGSLDSLTRLILVNAIYFKGDWEKQFEKYETKDRDFHISPTKSVNVKMMQRWNSEFFYGANQELNCAALELPYVGKNLSMFILLPDRTVTNLTALEHKLTGDHLMDVEKKFGMFKTKVNVWLPRFRLDEKLSLAETLSGIGMRDLFTEGVADLSGVDGTRQLYVSKVLHRAVVVVNEEGTEAAAATAVVVRCNSLGAAIREDPIDFFADHPFMFFIRDNSTKSILFLGRVVSPPAADVKKKQFLPCFHF